VTEAVDQKIEALIDLYDRMTPEARLFLERADPVTLKWLVKARPEEIAQLQEGITLVQASRTVGKFTKWAVLTVVGVFAAFWTASEWIVKLVAMVKGGH
jgi:hypothetical protein